MPHFFILKIFSTFILFMDFRSFLVCMFLSLFVYTFKNKNTTCIKIFRTNLCENIISRKKIFETEFPKKVRGIWAHIQELKITRSYKDMILTCTFGETSVYTYDICENHLRIIEYLFL